MDPQGPGIDPSLLIGDAAFVCSLAVMAYLSASAARRIRPDERVPMQFDFTGKPTWRLSRQLGLMFAPVMAAAFGLLWTALAHWLPAGAAGQTVAPRLMIALAFVVAHGAHLHFAIRRIEQERRGGPGA
jgi:hypothetical protein